MNDIDKLAAIAEIKRIKACYFRGVDTADGELVRGILAEDCELDYRGCCADPVSGTDYLPAFSFVLKGRESWSSDGLVKAGIVSVHQGHQSEIEIVSETSARAIWAMTDRLFMREGSNFSLLTGYGYYHETYTRAEGGWKIQTLRISRLRVEVQ